MGLHDEAVGQFLSTPSARRATIRHRRCSPSRSYFYPRPPRGGRRDRRFRCKNTTRFLSTPSARRATLSNMAKILRMLLFLSTPSARRATTQMSPACPSISYFYPRPPRGGRPNEQHRIPKSSHFYPRPPRGGRPHSPPCHEVRKTISIHALREEGDPT